VSKLCAKELPAKERRIGTMALDLVNQLTNDLQGDVLNQIASVTGESPAKTQTALASLVPAFLSGLARKASTSKGANDVLNQIRGENLTLVNPEDVLSESGVTALTNTGRALIDTFFGSRADSVLDWVSSSAGIARNSAAALASLCAPIVLGFIGRRLGSIGMTASALSDLLGIPGTYLQYAPAGLFAALGLDSSAAAGRHIAKKAGRPAKRVSTHASESASSGRRWMLPLLLVVGAIALLYYFLSTPQPVTAILP
jgi:hypothetical protein